METSTSKAPVPYSYISILTSFYISLVTESCAPLLKPTFHVVSSVRVSFCPVLVLSSSLFARSPILAWVFIFSAQSEKPSLQILCAINQFSKGNNLFQSLELQLCCRKHTELGYSAVRLLPSCQAGTIWAVLRGSTPTFRLPAGHRHCASSLFSMYQRTRWPNEAGPDVCCPSGLHQNWLPSWLPWWSL